MTRKGHQLIAITGLAAVMAAGSSVSLHSVSAAAAPGAGAQAGQASASSDPVIVVKDGKIDPAKAAATKAPRGTFETPDGEVVGGWASPEPTVRSTSAIEYVGGGKWNYGTYIDKTNYKTCWSYYDHNASTHSATSQFKNRTTNKIINRDFDRKVKGRTAIAQSVPVKPASTYTCQAFWNNKA